MSVAREINARDRRAWRPGYLGAPTQRDGRPGGLAAWASLPMGRPGGLRAWRASLWGHAGEPPYGQAWRPGYRRAPTQRDGDDWANCASADSLASLPMGRPGYCRAQTLGQTKYPPSLPGGSAYLGGEHLAVDSPVDSLWRLTLEGS